MNNDYLDKTEYSMKALQRSESFYKREINDFEAQCRKDVEFCKLRLKQIRYAITKRRRK